MCRHIYTPISKSKFAMKHSVVKLYYTTYARSHALSRSLFACERAYAVRVRACACVRASAHAHVHACVVVCCMHVRRSAVCACAL